MQRRDRSTWCRNIQQHAFESLDSSDIIESSFLACQHKDRWQYQEPGDYQISIISGMESVIILSLPECQGSQTYSRSQ